MKTAPRNRRPREPRRLAPAVMGVAASALGASCILIADVERPGDYGGGPQLAAIARLPAATFAPGPTSGAHLGPAPINGQEVPFVDQQPVQGFSALIDNGDGTFLAMPDNGFGTLESSADFVLRVYTLRPDWRTPEGGTGAIEVADFIELSDPDGKVPFAITNHFTAERTLTGADFDIESMQRAPDGTLWFGDEFGPFLLHTDAAGKLLDPPIPLPDFETGGDAEIRAPQSPYNEEGSVIRVMNAFHEHARRFGGARAPVFSPAHVLLDDGDATTVVPSREAPPEGSGLAAASSELFDVEALQTAGYAVVPYTVNDPARMTALMELGVSGLISDRPDLLRQAVAAFDADGDGQPGDYLDADGLIDGARFDAQGHRGGRDLRPENTLPAFEVALDELMPTLELDAGITQDLVPVVNHDPHVQAQKCRRANGVPYEPADEVLIRDLTVALLQSGFVCDKVFRGPQQLNDVALSPVAQAFAAAEGLPHPYVMPRLEHVFQFVAAYVAYYKTGAGAAHPDAELRWRNAERVRFNIETKVNPRAQFADRTIAFDQFTDTVAAEIVAAGLTDRADIQSFDFRTLLHVQEHFPEIRTVYLFGDFPIFDDPTVMGSDDGTNMQDENGENSPWFAGVLWPYRETRLTRPFRAQQSGGFEGMALSADGTKLYPLLEKPLEGAADPVLLIHEFDLASMQFTGIHATYALGDRATSASDFLMIDATRGLVIERDDTEGDLGGHKAVVAIELAGGGAAASSEVLVDLLRIADPNRLSEPGSEGDIGLGPDFAMPFVTIESIVLLGDRRIGVMNDNNYPFSVGRHLGTGLPDDSELVVIDVGRDLTPE